MPVNETVRDKELQSKAELCMNHKMRLMFSAGIAPLFVLLGIGLCFLEGVSKFFPIFLFVLAALFILFFAVLAPVITRQLVGRMMGERRIRSRWCFSGEEVSVSGEKESDAHVYYYTDFIRCDEYREFWLLYLARDSAFVLSKGAMTEGTAEDLSVLLAVKLKEKYRCHVKK